jgi:hypothetical protein
MKRMTAADLFGDELPPPNFGDGLIDPANGFIGDWAVWRYDSYPFFMTGEISGERGANGTFPILQYRRRFAPIAAVDHQTGRALWRQIEDLRNEKVRLQKMVDRYLRLKRDAVLKRLAPGLVEKLEGAQ